MDNYRKQEIERALKGHDACNWLLLQIEGDKRMTKTLNISAAEAQEIAEILHRNDNRQEAPAPSPAPSPAQPLPITRTQVFPVEEPKGKLRAYARVDVADQIRIRGLKLYDGPMGLFVLFPADPTYKEDDYQPAVFPLTREMRAAIEEAVIREYENAL